MARLNHAVFLGEKIEHRSQSESFPTFLEFLFREFRKKTSVKKRHMENSGHTHNPPHIGIK
jgi:hypothetical protein